MNTTQSGSSPRRGALLAAATRIGPSVTAHSQLIEQERTLPAVVVDLIRPTGAFRLWASSEVEGPDATAFEGLSVIEELAFHDGAAGWCSMIGSTTSLLSAFLPLDHVKEIFGGADSIAGGWAMPAGRAIAVDGGLRVSGRWQWGSGTQHSTWIGGGCLVVDENGKPEAREDGLGVAFVFFPAVDVEFIDTWNVSGLSGTGSGDYQVTDAFVPEGRWVQVGKDLPRQDNSLSRFSFYGLLACGIAACSVGIARRSIAELVILAASKKPQGSSRPLGHRSQIQADVAIAEAKLEAAWEFLRRAVEDMWDYAESGLAPSIDQKRRMRLSATHATQTAAEVTELMYKAGGGASIYQTSPLQRCFRDAFVATQHAMVAPRTFEMAGRLRLGLNTDTSLL